MTFRVNVNFLPRSNFTVGVALGGNAGTRLRRSSARGTSTSDAWAPDDLVQIGDAQLLARQLLDGLARRGTHAHLHGEGLGGLLEGVVHLDGRGLASRA